MPRSPSVAPQRVVALVVHVRQSELARERRDLHAACTALRETVDFLDGEIDVEELDLVGRQQPLRIDRGEVRHPVVVAGERFLPVAAHQSRCAVLRAADLREDHLRVDAVLVHCGELAVRLEVPGIARGLRIDEVLELEVLLTAAELGRVEDRLLLDRLVPHRVQTVRQAGLHPVVREVHVRVGGHQALGDGGDAGHDGSSCGRRGRRPIAPAGSAGDCARPCRRGQLEYRQYRFGSR